MILKFFNFQYSIYFYDRWQVASILIHVAALLFNRYYMQLSISLLYELKKRCQLLGLYEKAS